MRKRPRVPRTRVQSAGLNKKNDRFLSVKAILVRVVRGRSAYGICEQREHFPRPRSQDPTGLHRRSNYDLATFAPSHPTGISIQPAVESRGRGPWGERCGTAPTGIGSGGYALIDVWAHSSRWRRCKHKIDVGHLICSGLRALSFKNSQG